MRWSKVCAEKPDFDCKTRPQWPTVGTILVMGNVSELLLPVVQVAASALTRLRVPATRRTGSPRSRSHFWAARMLTPR